MALSAVRANIGTSNFQNNEKDVQVMEFSLIPDRYVNGYNII